MLLLGQDYNKMSCFKTWPVLSWIRKTIFFLVPNLTSGNMINYCIHFFLRSIKIWWQLEIGYWVLTILTSLCQYRIPSYSQVGVPLLRILTAIFRDKEIFPAITQARMLLTVEKSAAEGSWYLQSRSPLGPLSVQTPETGTWAHMHVAWQSLNQQKLWQLNTSVTWNTTDCST